MAKQRDKNVDLNECCQSFSVSVRTEDKLKAADLFLMTFHEENWCIVLKDI